METLSTGAGTACNWDEPAQDRGRTGPVPQHSAQVRAAQAPEPPRPTPRPLRESRLDPYEDYLLQRWSQGERNAAQLHREIRERGYPGSASMVRAYVAYLRTTTADGTPPRSRKERARALSPRALRWLLSRKREDLDQEERARLDQLLDLSPQVGTLYSRLPRLPQDGTRAQAPRFAFLDDASGEIRHP